MIRERGEPAIADTSKPILEAPVVPDYPSNPTVPQKAVEDPDILEVSNDLPDDDDDLVNEDDDIDDDEIKDNGGIVGEDEDLDDEDDDIA